MRPNALRRSAALALGLALCAPAPSDAFLGRLGRAVSGTFSRVLRRGATSTASSTVSRTSASATRSSVTGLIRRSGGQAVRGSTGARAAVLRQAGDGAQLTLTRGNFFVQNTATGAVRQMRGVSRTASRSVGQVARSRLRPNERIVRMTMGEFDNAAGGTVRAAWSGGRKGRWLTSATGGTPGAAAASVTQGAARTGILRKAGKIAMWGAAVVAGGAILSKGAGWVADTAGDPNSNGQPNSTYSGFGTYGTSNGTNTPSASANNNQLGNNTTGFGSASVTGTYGSQTAPPSGNGPAGSIPDFSFYNQKPTPDQYTGGVMTRPQGKK